MEKMALCCGQTKTGLPPKRFFSLALKATLLLWILLGLMASAASVPVIGERRADITANDLADILTISQKATQPRSQIWFVDAEEANVIIDGRMVLLLRVYLQPVMKTPRLHRGELLYLHDGEAAKSRKLIREGRWTFDPEVRENIESSYACVSAKPWRFRNQPGAIIDPREGPFEIHRHPAPGDGEIVAIIDAARRFFATPQPEENNLDTIRTLAADQPLLRIDNGNGLSFAEWKRSITSPISIPSRLDQSPNDCDLTFDENKSGMFLGVAFQRTGNQWRPVFANESGF